jgi:hypothetical protein
MAEIRPFQVDVTDEMLDDLRWRIGETRWPTRLPTSCWQR